MITMLILNIGWAAFVLPGAVCRLPFNNFIIQTSQSSRLVLSCITIYHYAYIYNKCFLLVAQCFGGMETYEKTTGMAMSENEPQGLLHQPGAAVTRDCTAVCRQSTNCKSFSVGKYALLFNCLIIKLQIYIHKMLEYFLDYDKSKCDSYQRDSVGQREKLREDPKTNYFEKICFRGGK